MSPFRRKDCTVSSSGRDHVMLRAVVPGCLLESFVAFTFMERCAFRRLRPVIPTDHDHLFRSIATSLARMLAAPLDDEVMSVSVVVVKAWVGRPGIQ